MDTKPRDSVSPSMHKPSLDFRAGASDQKHPPKKRRRSFARILAWCAATLVIALAAALTLGWWWAGGNTSLASTLVRIAHFLPAGQQLESKEVSGNLRAGGKVGWLRWSSPSLSVEIQDLHIGWQLSPLLQYRLHLDEVRAARVQITPIGASSAEPTKPLQQVELPIQVHLPFHIEHIQWAGTPPLDVANLKGTYVYDGDNHQLNIAQVHVAQGHYSAQARLQAQAPMAITLSLEGKVQALLPGNTATPLEIAAHAELKGQLSGAEAQLEVKAALTPTSSDDISKSMHADLQASLKPWAQQPLVAAHADVQELNLAAVWPQAPATLLSGKFTVAPLQSIGLSPSKTAGWSLSADLNNALPGPWDQQRIPASSLQAQAQYDGVRWTVPAAKVLLGSGSIEASGHYALENSATDAVLHVRNLRPDLLHSALAAAPLNGRISAQGQGDRHVHFQADIRAAKSVNPIPAKQAMRIDLLSAQGHYNNAPDGATVSIDHLIVEALNARMQAKSLQAQLAHSSGQGLIQVSLPGLTASIDGNLAPEQGKGKLQVQITEADRIQRWLNDLPGMHAKIPMSARGQAQWDLQWTGGWKTAWEQATAVAQGKPPIQAAHGFSVRTQLSSTQLELTVPATAEKPTPPTTLHLRNLKAEVMGSFAKAQIALDGQLHTGSLQTSLHTRAETALQRSGQWQVLLNVLSLQAQEAKRPGPWHLAVNDPVTVTFAPSLVKVTGSTSRATLIESSSGQMRVTGPMPGAVAIHWQPVRYSGGGSAPMSLQTQGTLQGIPLAWIDALGTLDTQGKMPTPLLSQWGIAGDLIFDGEWNVDTTGLLRAHAILKRTTGDLRLLSAEKNAVTFVQSSGTGTGSGSVAAVAEIEKASQLKLTTQAGVREAAVRLEIEDKMLRANLLWNTERAGEINAQASTQLTLDPSLTRIHLAEDAPLVGSIKAKLPDVGAWSALAPPGWRVRGTLDANVILAGTRTAPTWTGTLGADQLSVRSVLDGVELQDGHLRALLRGNTLEVTEFRLQGGRGSKARITGFSGNRTSAPAEGGTLNATGRVRWGAESQDASGIGMDFNLNANALQVLVRADRQVSVTGQLHATLQDGQFRVQGKLTTDRATIVLPDESAPSLSSDVVVRSAAKDQQAQTVLAKEASAHQTNTRKPPEISVLIDLGNDFALQGMGITTRLAGRLEVRNGTTAGAPPRITGEIRTEQGRYRAWGQMLDVETGLIRFNGPYNNPSLDILALRPNIAVRAGVQVTGSALSPRVRLYSDPDLPDAEKLSWVVMGRNATAGGAEAAMLQQAALALLGGNGSSGMSNGIASRLGLDEIGFKGPSAGEDASRAALTFGKRLSNDLYVTYERSLSGTLGTLYIFYDLSRRLTLRGQTGEKSAVDIIYTVKYD